MLERLLMNKISHAEEVRSHVLAMQGQTREGKGVNVLKEIWREIYLLAPLREHGKEGTAGPTPMRVAKMEPILRWKWESAPPPPLQFWSCRFWGIFSRGVEKDNRHGSRAGRAFKPGWTRNELCNRAGGHQWLRYDCEGSRVLLTGPFHPGKHSLLLHITKGLLRWLV